VSPYLFSCQRVVNLACCPHLLAPFAFIRIIYDQIEGFPFLGSEGIEKFIGLLCQCMLRLPSPHIEKIVESCSVVKGGSVQILAHRSDTTLLPYKGNQHYQHFKIFEVPKTAVFKELKKLLSLEGNLTILNMKASSDVFGIYTLISSDVCLFI
jgi:hypothetical protein